MPRQVPADINRLATQTTEHIASINQAISDLDREYTQLLSGLREMDSATIAALMETTQQFRVKVIARVQILERILTFISSASTQIQAQNQAMAERFGSRQGGQ